jgi:hypothetical protein
MDLELIIVDEAEEDKGLGDPGAAGQGQVLPGLRLQLRDLSGDVVLDQPEIPYASGEHRL